MSENKNNYENLTYQKKSFYEIFAENEAMIDSAYAYAKDYMTYLDASKTEREAVSAAIELAEAQGYRPYRLGDKIEAGDRLYYNNRGKNLFLIKAGTEDINNGIRIIAAHVDSPRLDLKPCPLYEDRGMAFFKTHYYGGVR